MDFFTLQDNAKKQTYWLIVLFLLAVLMIILGINTILFFAFGSYSQTSNAFEIWLAKPYWLWVSLGVVGVIAFMSFLRSWQLNKKPDAIADMVGAVPVDWHTQNPQLKQLINIVEEISIASGTPIPRVYLMPNEMAINAFVSGLKPSSTCLVVTQGLLEKLDRQELQGVIAHEFSHIFHGDMRINLRLIGVLAGLLVIGQLGMFLARTGRYGGYNRRTNNSSGNAGAIIIVGIGLLAIGYIGLFFGRLIKAAVSRQREYLADASAVQFTRDNQGISHALGKIYQHGSRLTSNKSEEVSHMCFGEAIKINFSGLLSTHPPLLQRIKAINPQLSRQLSSAKRTSQTAQSNSHSNSVVDSLAMAAAPMTTGVNQKKVDKINNKTILRQAGMLSSQQINSVKKLANKIPETLRTFAKDDNQTSSSYDLIIALLLANQNSKNYSLDVQPFALKSKELLSIIEQIDLLDFTQQHYLLEVSLARIESYPLEKNKGFVSLLARLVTQDKNISLTEFMIYISAIKRTLPVKSNNKPINKFKKIADEIAVFFSWLYQQSQFDANTKADFFIKQMRLLGIAQEGLSSSVVSGKSIKQLSRALNQIARLNPLLKKQLMQLSIDISEKDGQITRKEYELIRLLAEYLDIPLPIFVD